MFKWREEYSCNIEEIDKQHKRLFELGRELYSLVVLDDGYDHYDDIMNILNELKRYAAYHFNYEEELMIKYDFPGFDEQKFTHDAFVRKIKKFEGSDLEGQQKKVLLEVLEFTANWIEKHILKSDMQYKDYLNERGVF